MSPAMRRRTWSRKSSTRASTIAWSYLSYLYMSDHPVAGRGVGGLYRQVRAHGRAARANAVLDMSGARPLRGAHGVDHIAAVDAAGAFPRRSDERRVGRGGVQSVDPWWSP